MKESEKILMTQNRSRKDFSENMYSPRSIYTTVGRRKSRDAINFDNPLYKTEANTTQTIINDLNNSYHFNTTLQNKNFSRAKSNTRMNTNNNLYGQNFVSKLGNFHSNLRSQQQLQIQQQQQLNMLNNSNLLMNNSNFNNSMMNNNNNNNNNLINNNFNNNVNNNNNILNNTMSSGKLQNISNSQTTLMQNVSIANIKEENERVKLSNSVLSKSNMDLKNQVRLLQIELSATSAGNPNSMQQRMQDDPQLAQFVQNLKGALSTSQNSNQELTGLFEGLQKKNAEVSRENLILKEQNDLANKELESLSKKFSDARFSVDELTSELRKLENEKTVLLIHKNDFEEKYKLAEEKVENLISINESHLKCKNDNLEMIENLKLTIEALRRGSENDSNKASLTHKVEELEALLKEKSYNMESLQSKLKSFENDREYFNQELKLMERELKEKDKFIEELQQKFHEANTESEKAKSRIEALLINIDERDQTIHNLKTSMSFISTTIEDYKHDYDKIRLQTDGDSVEKSKLIKELELTNKKLIDLNVHFDALQKDKEILQKRNLETENDLNEKKMSLSKLNFELDVLTQKLENSQSFMERMQEDLKNSKLNKINEEFQAEIAKSSEERSKRLKELEKTIAAKNKQIEDLQQQIHEVNLLKDEKVNELQAVINKKNAEGKELEYKTNDKVTELKNEIELSRQEIYMFKSEKERENMEITSKYNQLKFDYDLLQHQNKALQKSFDDYIQNKNNSYLPSSNYKVDTNSTNAVNNNNVYPNSSNNANVISTTYQTINEKDANVFNKNFVKGQNFDAEGILKKIRETTANLSVNNSSNYLSSKAYEAVNKLQNNNSVTSNLVAGGNSTLGKNYLSNSGNYYDLNTGKKSNTNADINKFDSNTYNILNATGNPGTTKYTGATKYYSGNVHNNALESTVSAYGYDAGIIGLNSNYSLNGDIVSGDQVSNKYTSDH
jgi:hypothetical protein